jgi:hypothetical protein
VLCDGLKQILVAFAVLLSDAEAEEVAVRGPAALEIGDRRIEALIACEAVAADRVRQRAGRRAAELANQGTIGAEATFLVSGVVWGSLASDSDPELDMTIGPANPDDLVAGASGVQISFLEAARVAGAA